MSTVYKVSTTGLYDTNVRIFSLIFFATEHAERDMSGDINIISEFVDEKFSKRIGFYRYGQKFSNWQDAINNAKPPETRVIIAYENSRHSEKNIIMTFDHNGEACFRISIFQYEPNRWAYNVHRIEEDFAIRSSRFEGQYKTAFDAMFDAMRDLNEVRNG